jgi:RNA polymerase sigma factor (sigma-70 family)
MNRYHLYADLNHLVAPPDMPETEMDTWQEDAAKKLKTIIWTRLTCRQREIILLYYYEGLNQRQIAQKLGVTESNVSHIKSRACQKLSEDLALLRKG